MKLRHLCLAVLLAAPLHVFAAAFAQLERFFEVTTFKAFFIQQVYDDRKELLEISEGTVWFNRPGRFRWEYHKPDEYIIVTDGLNLLAYDPALSQAYVRPTVEALGTAPLVLLLNRRGVLDDFRVDTLPDRDGLEWVQLTPRVDDSEFIRFEAGFSQHGIQKMTLFDRFDQRIEIQFHEVQTGIAVPPEQFRLHLPKGTDVIGNYLH